MAILCPCKSDNNKIKTELFVDKTTLVVVSKASVNVKRVATIKSIELN